MGFRDVPDWFSWENQGAGVAVADLTGTGTHDLVVLMVDAPPGQNQAKYRVGRDLGSDGEVTGGWGPWRDVPDWFSWENQGAGVAVADLTGTGTHDLVAFGVDGAEGQNQAFFRVARNIKPDGAAAAGWSSLKGVNNWLFWENQYSEVALTEGPGGPELWILAVDHPQGGNGGHYMSVPLREDPSIHGSWEVLPFDSQVLAVHAALLNTGKVLFFAGSGNNRTRAEDSSFGDVGQGMWTSVVWDPDAPQGQAFFHPDTHHRADKGVFDFFCGGNTFLADGTLLSGGGNLTYGADHNNLGQRDVAAFDPDTEQWSARAAMRLGRWYPTLLTLADGGVLAVSGKNDTNGDLNRDMEIYNPAKDSWTQRTPPQSPEFVGLPFYAHLFLLADGRIFFSGGRMDDDRPQGPGILDLAAAPATFQPVPTVGADQGLRNQSSSVLLPPAQDQTVMIIGGGPGEDLTSATGHTEVARLDQPAPRFTPTMPLSLPRMHLNAVLLPDRTVFVSGGAIKHEEADVPPIPRLQSEIYDPAMDTWRPGAVASVIRMYHSVALLLPDGRVVTASGNPPPYGHAVPWKPPQPNEELRIEVFRPPYLFRGPRPVIENVPTEWGYNSSVTIKTPQARSILWAHLMRPGVTTHAFDNSQRLVDLPIRSRTDVRLQVDGPSAATLAPPGWYMVFLVCRDRVPSVATWVHVR